MNDLRTVAQQALEALEQDNPSGRTATITALRAALAQPAPEPTRSQKLAAAGFTRRPSLKAMEMRAALELIAAPPRSDGTWNRDREACRQIAAEALGRYDDE